MMKCAQQHNSRVLVDCVTVSLTLFFQLEVLNKLTFHNNSLHLQLESVAKNIR